MAFQMFIYGRILKILFYSAILLIPPWLFFGEGMKQVYKATEYMCVYSLYVALILGYIVFFYRRMESHA